MKHFLLTPVGVTAQQPFESVVQFAQGAADKYNRRNSGSLARDDSWSKS